MKTVFICSPYRPTGNDPETELNHNITVAKAACKKAVLDGYQVVCPHLFYPQFLHDNNHYERDKGIKLGLFWIKFVDELWIINDRITDGMKIEIDEAKKFTIPVKYVKVEDKYESNF